MVAVVSLRRRHRRLVLVTSPMSYIETLQTHQNEIIDKIQCTVTTLFTSFLPDLPMLSLFLSLFCNDNNTSFE